MKIRLAKTAGFCFGVNRAVELVYELLGQDRRVCTLGPIIHNPQMVAQLEEKGVKSVSSPDEAEPGQTLVIRSHGVARAVLERAHERGLSVVDATCPFVEKIHKIVSDASDSGRTVLIAGDESHGEVLGIRGHVTGPSYVFEDNAALLSLLEVASELKEAPLTVVAQTTFDVHSWEKCQKTLKKVCTNAIVFDTICNATAIRQNEAATLAQQCDTMLVIGGRSSSNTAKLYEICRVRCPNTHLVETAAELKAEWFTASRLTGVAAGASTPAVIIKEVLQTMSEIVNPADGQEENAVVETPVEQQAQQPEQQEPAVEQAPPVEKSFDEMTFEEALEASLNSLNTEQRVKGVVLAVSPTEIQVDIGRKHTGYVPASEYSADSSVNLEDEVKVGDVMDLIVIRTNDQEGTVMLSKRRFDAIAGWDEICAAKETNDVIEGVVTDIIKGGLSVNAKGIRVFIPASQATARRGEPLDELKGKQVSFRIIELGRGHRAVGSIRSVLLDERKRQADKLWETIAVGDRFTGIVKSLTNYGAFVDLGGVDGMIHISELSWERIKHPSEVVKVGDVVEVYVKKLDPEKRKISLGYKKDEDNPWEILKEKYPIGTVLPVTIVSMTQYGAFARVIPGIDGLIHISQIANRHIEKPQDELKFGQEVEAKIIGIDFEKHRVSLSIRALLPDAPVEDAAPVEQAPAVQQDEEAPATAAAEASEAEAEEPSVVQETPAENAAPAEEAATVEQAVQQDEEAPATAAAETSEAEA